MNKRQIDRFFRVLARELDAPAQIVLTGAAAGSLWGQVRPSLDVDFAITPVRWGQRQWARFEEAIQRASRLTGIQANYAEDIDRWGPITLLDWRHHTMPYRTFGTLRVRLLDPAYWSIGKLSRYLDPDVEDMVTVLKRQRMDPRRLIRLWARALRASPRSVACTQFRRQAEHFLRAYGRRIWGRQFDPERAVRHFSNSLAKA